MGTICGIGARKGPVTANSTSRTMWRWMARAKSMWPIAPISAFRSSMRMVNSSRNGLCWLTLGIDLLQEGELPLHVRRGGEPRRETEPGWPGFGSARIVRKDPGQVRFRAQYRRGQLGLDLRGGDQELARPEILAKVNCVSATAPFDRTSTNAWPSRTSIGSLFLGWFRFSRT